MPKKDKISLKEMFEEYAKNELELIKNSDPEKLYHRVIPNLKDKEKGNIDFLYKKIIVDFCRQSIAFSKGKCLPLNCLVPCQD